MNNKNCAKIGTRTYGCKESLFLLLDNAYWDEQRTINNKTETQQVNYIYIKK